MKKKDLQIANGKNEKDEDACTTSNSNADVNIATDNNSLAILYRLQDKINKARDYQERRRILERLQSILDAPTTALEDLNPPQKMKHRGRPKGSQRLPVPADSKAQEREKSSVSDHGDECPKDDENEGKRPASESTPHEQPPKKIRVVFNLKQEVYEKIP